MTYNVFRETLNLAQSINPCADRMTTGNGHGHCRKETAVRIETRQLRPPQLVLPQCWRQSPCVLVKDCRVTQLTNWHWTINKKLILQTLLQDNPCQPVPIYLKKSLKTGTMRIPAPTDTYRVVQKKLSWHDIDTTDTYRVVQKKLSWHDIDTTDTYRVVQKKLYKV